MTLEEECILSYYKEIASLSEEHCVYLVQHVESHKIYVKKILKIYNAEVFHYLKENHIKNTPEIYEVFEHQDRLIVIEEYLNGTNLQEQLDAGITFQESQVVQMIYQLCEILMKLHHARPSIIHRDIKPSNIIISPDNVLKLLDMNAAKRSSSRSVKDTVLMGTVGYAAPEQYGFGTSSMQTDIYAVGVLMNVLLTGGFPQEGLAKGRLAPIIAKCTKLEPKERFFSVDDIITELEKLQNRESAPNEKKRECPYAPPGFRTLKPGKMITACLGYFFIFWVGANLEVEPVTNNLDLWLNRIAAILICLSEIFFWGDYLDLQEKIGLSKIQNPAVRLSAKIGFSVFLVFFLTAALVTMEMILGL